jgi:hypothetical protein
MQLDVWDWDTRAAIFATWERLPDNAKRALGGVRFVEDASLKVWANAGDFDIRVRSLTMRSQAAAIAVVAHELGHVAGSHFRRCAAGALSRDDAELEADEYARSWGFAKELEQRRAFYGR